MKLLLLLLLLLSHLSKIINKSILTGTFLANWKEALITPLLKKGDPHLKENYRPVSCLPAASKLLEKIVFVQASDYLEKNKLLPVCLTTNMVSGQKGQPCQPGLTYSKIG